MSVVVSGLDVHKDYTYATILGPDGEKLTQRRMQNEEIPAFLKPYRVERVAMETSTSIAPLYRMPKEEGYRGTVSHHHKTRYIAEAHIEADRLIARILTHLPRANLIPECYVPPREVRSEKNPKKTNISLKDCLLVSV